MWALDKDGKIIADRVEHIDTWRALESFYKQGKLRAIGLSNFNERQIKALYDQAEIKPHNLQVLREYCRESTGLFLFR